MNAQADSGQGSGNNQKRHTIAGFELLKKLGEGAVGIVLVARQLSMDRLVAIKILHREQQADPEVKERFLREARLSAQLNHLNIINGIDCGEDKGYTYFAMEYVEGHTLQEILAKYKKLKPEGAFKIMRQMADALIYAHGIGLVHRDIKPDNIMLTKDGTAKLCDLGLAHKVGAPEEDHAVKKGVAVGTPHYISPEQARADKNVDGRSDIYALGGTFYHLLTGRTPFQGDKAMVIMARHLTESAPNPCDIDPNIPLDFGAIISKMMAKVPDDRYLKAEDLAADLDAAKRGERPSAFRFRGNSSCALPARLSGGSGRTTGPQSPVRRTSGRHNPVRRTGRTTSVRRRRFGQR